MIRKQGAKRNIKICHMISEDIPLQMQADMELPWRSFPRLFCDIRISKRLRSILERSVNQKLSDGWTSSTVN